MASSALRAELDCSICLTVYTDPVTLRCGHNFCRDCIDRVLNTQDESGVYSCPECRVEYPERPVLQRNITLRNVVEHILSTERHQEEITGICCTYCIHSPVPAVKTCLTCEASLCDGHLKAHIKAGEHILTEPTMSLEKRKCSVHKKVLEYYCTEDATCICVSCSLAGEHRGHRVEMLDEVSEKKKKTLRNVLQKLTTKREETEERVQSLEERRRKAQEKASGEAERVTALFIDIRRRLDDLEKKVLSEISRQEKEKSLSLSDVIQKLEIKKAELSMKMRHIEELCNMTDPLTVLQEPDTGDLCDPEEGGGDEDTGGHDRQRQDVDIGYISDTIHTGLLHIVDTIKSSLNLKGKKDDTTSVIEGPTIITPRSMVFSFEASLEPMDMNPFKTNIWGSPVPTNVKIAAAAPDRNPSKTPNIWAFPEPTNMKIADASPVKNPSKFKMPNSFGPPKPTNMKIADATPVRNPSMFKKPNV
ncbi:E3 ubiquitin/ISG15 ligase TRIM25-like [Leptodactylus fuscus]|uniref:E3 ubiquitin/ISG15 ligase TRIM25-like n=1 Tax=Leptodactylus fuscus TaxID=238119 RepID=UPI003F4E8CAD